MTAASIIAIEKNLGIREPYAFWSKSTEGTFGDLLISLGARS